MTKFSVGDMAIWANEALLARRTMKIVEIHLSSTNELMYRYEYLHDRRVKGITFITTALYYDQCAIKPANPNKIWKELNE